jgi:hypothetical protein
LLELLQAKHTDIADYLPSVVGYDLLYLESEIILEVMRRCGSEGIPALPIHDALLAPTEQHAPAKTIMESVFREKAGVDAPVSITLNTLSDPHVPLTEHYNTLSDPPRPSTF